MHIAMLTHSLGTRGGGISSAVLTLSEGLSRTLKVTLIASEMTDNLPKRCQSIGYSVVGPRKFGFSTDLPRILISLDVDVLHLHGLWTYCSLAASQWARATRRPLVVSPHGMMDSWALGRSRVRKRVAMQLFQYRTLRDSATLHALCESEKVSLLSMLPNATVCCIPNAVSMHSMGHVVATSASVDVRPKLLFLGRINPKKGLSNLLYAWHLALQDANFRSANWQLIIAGWDDSDYLPQLEKIVTDLKLANCVSFPGAMFGEAKHQAISSCDAMVLPSFSEGLPMSVLEGWSLSRPALITKACNLPEGFATGAAIELSTDYVQLSDQLVRGLSDRYNLIELGKRGRQLVEDNFSLDSVTEKWMSTYSHLISR
ncbi:glycosyltransferase [Aestuariivirga sp.]|uniref:glycosyltransferase n=1 Tax=Aestuariivirga sp. TaxID=2650926 RepID=UPI003BAB6D6D